MTTHRPWSLFVAAVLAWLLGIGKCVDRLPQTPWGKARLEVYSLAGALSLFRFDVGRYPSTAEGLQALVLDPGVANWAGPYLGKKGLQDDPWGREYQYCAIGSDAFQIWSLGADGKEGGTGEAADIRKENE